MEQPHPNPETDNPQGYVPRPRWQLWGARICAAVFVLLVILQIISIARGGL